MIDSHLRDRYAFPKVVAAARYHVWEWITGEEWPAGVVHEGFPRTWAQEEADEAWRRERGYPEESVYDSDLCEAPVILGYEELEREGKLKRLADTVGSAGEARAHFVLIETAE